MGILSDLIGQSLRCRGREEECPAASEAGTAATVLFPPHPDRLAWVLINLSVNPIYLGLTDAVTALHGFRVAPNGGFVCMRWDEDLGLVGREWWVIAPAGASAYYWLQVIGEGGKKE